jgi:hypothetical protein
MTHAGVLQDSPRAKSQRHRMTSPYRGRRVSLATRHGKERAVARPFRRALGLEVVVPPELDTDALGAFTGECPRQGTALETCLRKAHLGMAATGLPLGIANEGSFGPHPFVPFIPAGIEVMSFIDAERELVITETILAERTNYGHREARCVADLQAWLPTVGFPSHGLIVRTTLDGPGAVIGKGITSIDRLIAAMVQARAQSDTGRAWVEADMRAHFNPTRMASIRRLAFRLARRIGSACPACAAPGWGPIGTLDGLPCEECGEPSTLVRCERLACTVCAHREERPRRDGLQTASARYCPQCNP